MIYKPGDIISTEGLIPFPENKTARELGLKVGDMCVSVVDGCFKEGEIFELCEDDESYIPYFSNGKEECFISLCNLAPLPITTKKQLPQYFFIKQCDNPLWKEYIAWLNKRYEQDWYGNNMQKYLGYDGSNGCNGTRSPNDISIFQNNPTLLTLEEWKEMTTEEVVVQENTDTPENRIVYGIKEWQKRYNNKFKSSNIFWEEYYRELGKLMEEHSKL